MTCLIIVEQINGAIVFELWIGQMHADVMMVVWKDKMKVNWDNQVF